MLRRVWARIGTSEDEEEVVTSGQDWLGLPSTKGWGYGGGGNYMKKLM